VSHNDRIKYKCILLCNYGKRIEMWPPKLAIMMGLSREWRASRVPNRKYEKDLNRSARMKLSHKPSLKQMRTCWSKKVWNLNTTNTILRYHKSNKHTQNFKVLSLLIPYLYWNVWLIKLRVRKIFLSMMFRIPNVCDIFSLPLTLYNPIQKAEQ
jgi:hypothetical protein